MMDLAAQARRLQGSRDGRAALNLVAELLRDGWNVHTRDREQNHQMETALMVLNGFIEEAGQVAGQLRQLTDVSMKHTEVFEEQKRRLARSTERVHEQQDELKQLSAVLEDRQVRIEQYQRKLEDIAKLAKRDPQLSPEKRALYNAEALRLIREKLT